MNRFEGCRHHASFFFELIRPAVDHVIFVFARFAVVHVNTESLPVVKKRLGKYRLFRNPLLFYRCLFSWSWELSVAAVLFSHFCSKESNALFSVAVVKVKCLLWLVAGYWVLLYNDPSSLAGLFLCVFRTCMYVCVSLSNLFLKKKTRITSNFPVFEIFIFAFAHS